jgi:CheY-like chemotaxis protein
VVDDNVSVLRALCTLLERAGDRVEGAALGRDALAAAASRPPRVALVDLDLPDIGGHEVAAALRERVPGVVLVATTGFSDERTRRRCARRASATTW